MGKYPLDRLERVDLRECWAREAIDFTPWLSQEENLSLLAETLGMEMQLEETEVNIGPFRADILCREIGMENYVLIENQLERTDHIHLGQIITYDAGLDAASIIWISSKFTEEHRAAIDWLNRITAEEFSFFGVEVELWKIGDSPAAPRFNVVSMPNAWSKRLASKARGGISPDQQERARQYREFWADLEMYFEKYDAPFRLGKTTGMHWINLPIENNKLRLILSYSFKDLRFKMFLLFRPKDDVEWFRYAYAKKDEIGKVAGAEIEWYGDMGDEVGYALIVKEVEAETPKDMMELYTWIMQRASGIKNALESLTQKPEE